MSAISVKLDAGYLSRSVERARTSAPASIIPLPTRELQLSAITPPKAQSALAQAATHLALQESQPWIEQQSHFRAMPRSDLATAAYGVSSRYTSGERSEAKLQLETNDKAFMDRARSLSMLSGDERVHWQAQLDLDANKGNLERDQTAAAEGSIDRDQLGKNIAAMNQAIGQPSSIALRYPNGWTSQKSEASQTAANLGAERVAQTYRLHAFED